MKSANETVPKISMECIHRASKCEKQIFVTNKLLSINVLNIQWWRKLRFQCHVLQFAENYSHFNQEGSSVWMIHNMDEVSLRAYERYIAWAFFSPKVFVLSLMLYIFLIKFHRNCFVGVASFSCRYILTNLCNVT